VRADRLGRISVPVRLIGHTVEVIAVDGLVKVLDGDEDVADHGLVAPGKASVHDDLYGGARPDKPLRSVRPSTPAEKAFWGLGAVAEAFLKGAAAAGVAKRSKRWPASSGCGGAMTRTGAVRADPSGACIHFAKVRVRLARLTRRRGDGMCCRRAVELTSRSEYVEMRRAAKRGQCGGSRALGR
jgi:hypothetical protein